MDSTNAEETIEAKLCFEQYAFKHVDSGVFASNLLVFRKVVHKAKQTLTFCDINAHWQNVIAEKRIQELQEHA